MAALDYETSVPSPDTELEVMGKSGHASCARPRIDAPTPRSHGRTCAARDFSGRKPRNRWAVVAACTWAARDSEGRGEITWDAGGGGPHRAVAGRGDHGSSDGIVIDRTTGRRRVAFSADKADANEVEQIRRALGVVGEAIGLERRTITALSVGLAARTIDAEPIAPPKDRAWLAVNTVGAPELADFAAQIEAVAREAARQGGALAGAAGGVVMAHWGAERDDALRAVLAARAVSEALAGRVSAPVTIAVGVGKDASGWASAREQAGADAGTGAMLVTIIGPEAYEDAAAQIVTAAVG